MITYNKIIERFRRFYAAHQMLSSFSHGEFERSGLFKAKDYPALHVAPGPTRLEQGARVYTFDIYAFELYREDEDAQLTIAHNLSDTHSILEDLVAEIKNGFNHFAATEFMVLLPVNLQPFIEEDEGVANGWLMTIEIETAFTADSCLIPSSAVTPPAGGCDPVTITHKGATFTTVASGLTWAIPENSHETKNSAGEQLAIIENIFQAPGGVDTENTLSDMTLEKLDGTSTAVVVRPGGTISQAGTQILQVAAGETGFTWTIGSEISTATVTAEAATNITGAPSITVNGGGAVSTLIGVELDDGDVVVFSFTPTDTGQEVEFTLTF